MGFIGRELGRDFESGSGEAGKAIRHRRISVHCSAGINLGARTRWFPSARRDYLVGHSGSANGL